MYPVTKRVFVTNNYNTYLKFEAEFKAEHPTSTETFFVLGYGAFIRNRSSFWEFLETSKKVAVDIETTHTDAYCGKIVLVSFYFPNGYIYTFDTLTIPLNEIVTTECLRNTTIIAHNLMFETLWFLVAGIHFKRTHCTMLAEQKLTQGISEFHYNLPAVLKRRGVVVPEYMDKDIRKDFGDNYTEHQLKHVLYNQSDVEALFELQDIQNQFIISQSQQFLIHHIHFPLIRVLALAQLEGMVINESKFTALAEQAEETMARLEIDMATHVKETFKHVNPATFNKPLIDLELKLKSKLQKLEDRRDKNFKLAQNYINRNKTHLKAYVKTVEALKNIATDIGTTQHEITQLVFQPFVTWSSTKQVLALLAGLGCNHPPTGKDKKTHKFKPSLGKAARERWLLKNKNSIFYQLISLYNDYMKQTKHVNSFGKSFLVKYKHPVTGKYHTSYKQGTVATGRLASGASKDTPPKFNSQQIMRLKALRECFGTDPGYSIVTCDLRGAELITMCSLANDMNLLQLHAQGDLHSYFANKGWEAIYKYRGLPWQPADVISQTQNKDKRTAYKPMLFGTVYGLMPPKAAETLNISEYEGRIAINTIIKEIPDTIEMVKEATRLATINGYVIHNTRTNSRRWFYPVFTARKENRVLSFVESREVEGGARNTRIQGTQADMLLESMVLLQRFIDIYKLDAVILMQVHDEMVVKFNDRYLNWFPQRVSDVMTRTANKYLQPGIYMEAEVSVGKSWTK